jgi:hypothetical protein
VNGRSETEISEDGPLKRAATVRHLINSASHVHMDFKFPVSALTRPYSGLFAFSPFRTPSGEVVGIMSLRGVRCHSSES